jgi:hypothetical protein
VFGSPNKTDAGPDGRIAGVWTNVLALGWEGGMQWRVMVELGGAEGTLKLREVIVGECATAIYSAEMLVLTVAEDRKNAGWAAALSGPGAGR